LLDKRKFDAYEKTEKKINKIKKKKKKKGVTAGLKTYSSMKYLRPQQ
jgi:hypothetical protein